MITLFDLYEDAANFITQTDEEVYPNWFIYYAKRVHNIKLDEIHDEMLLEAYNDVLNPLRHSIGYFKMLTTKLKNIKIEGELSDY